MDTLPFDVLLYLADEFLPSHDRASLSATCTQMLCLRPVLFRKLCLVKADYTSAAPPGLHLLDLVRRKSPVCSYVRDLEVFVETPSVLPFVQILSSLKFLRKLHLTIPWHHGVTRSSIARENALVALVALPTLQSLTFGCDWNMPIVKITNAFATDVRPIDDLDFRCCPRDCKHAFAPDKEERMHGSRRWRPTHLGIHRYHRLYQAPVATFIDASKLRTLTIDWPPSVDFDMWGNVSLDQLRLHVMAGMSPLGTRTIPKCARLYMLLHGECYVDRPLDDIAAFLSRAEGIPEICVKVVTLASNLRHLISHSGPFIRHAIFSARTSLSLGLSINAPFDGDVPHHRLGWDKFVDCRACEDCFRGMQTRLQACLPSECHGRTYKAELLFEKERDDYWSWTPVLDENLRVHGTLLAICV